MMEDILIIFKALEKRREKLTYDIQTIAAEQLVHRPGPDKWSVLQHLQHIIWGERAIRMSEAELRNNPVREHLKPGKLVDVVKDVLDKDIPVDVPDPSLTPDGKSSLPELLELWKQEREGLNLLLETVNEKNSRKVMFSHPAAGPLTPLLALELALAHFDSHRRQIELICGEKVKDGM